MNSAAIEFRDFIRANGLEAPENIQPGVLMRFAGTGKGPGNRAGWCLLFDDGLAGYFGDWSTGRHDKWISAHGYPQNPRERASLDQKMQSAREQARHQLKRDYAEAAKRAYKIWECAKIAPLSHPYLQKKGIKPHNARLHSGCLILPLTAFHGEITSLQFIHANGAKNLLKGGRKKGSFITVSGDEDTARQVIICEGWATGCTLAEQEPDALVLAAVDAWNLKLVGLGARDRWPSARIVIAGDDDRLTSGNPGATQALEAARAANAEIVLPEWPVDAPDHLSDFNDLAQWLLRGKP